MKSAIVLLVVALSVVVAKPTATTKLCKAAETVDEPKKCAIFCRLQNSGKLNEKAEINLEKFDEKTRSKATECAEKNKQENLCERGEAFQKCYRNATNTPKPCKAAQGVDDPKQCATLCRLQTAGKLNEKAELNLEKFIEKNKSKATECAEKNKQENLCERAEAFQKCFRNATVTPYVCKAAEGADDHKKCAILCRLQNSGKLNEKAEIHLEKFDEKTRSKATECAEKNKQANLCERGEAFLKCFRNATNTPKPCKAAQGVGDPKQCATLCRLQNAGKLNEKAELNLEKFIEKNKSKATECAEKNKQKNLCERAEAFQKCFRNATSTPYVCKAAEGADDSKKCAILCRLQKTGTLNEKAEINLEKFDEKTRSKATECAEKNKQENLCERGEAFQKCYRNATNTPKPCKAAQGVDDPKQCATLCRLQNAGKLNEKAELNLEKFIEENKSKATECAEKNKQENLCIRAEAFQKCFRNATFTPYVCKAAEGANDPKKCAILCRLQNSGKLNEKAEINLEKFDYQTRSKATECAEKNKQSNLCERGEAFLKCFRNATNTPKQCKAAQETDDPKQCATLCRLQNAGKLNEKAEVNLEKFIEKDKPKATECAEKNKQENLCERAEAFQKCFRIATNGDNIIEYSKQCANETSTVIESGTLTVAVFNKFDDKKACYHRCMLIKSGRLNEQNEVDFNKVAARLVNKDDVSKKCYEANKQKDQCVQAIRRMTCVRKEVAQKKKDVQGVKGANDNKEADSE